MVPKTTSLFAYLMRTVILALFGALILVSAILLLNHIKGSLFWSLDIEITIGCIIMGALISFVNYRKFLAPIPSLIHNVIEFGKGNFTVHFDEAVILNFPSLKLPAPPAPLIMPQAGQQLA